MATATARADLEALLRARKLDRTVPSAAPTAGVEGVPTGIPSLDGRLGAGLPRGELSEVTGPRSSGRASLVQSALAALTREGGLAALVDPLDMFDPPSAGEAGIVLDRVLWVRGEALSTGRVDILLDRGLKALNLVLQAGGFDLVVFDLAEAPHEAIRRLPFTTWFRLQRAIEGGPDCVPADGASADRAQRGRGEHPAVTQESGIGIRDSGFRTFSSGVEGRPPRGAGRGHGVVGRRVAAETVRGPGDRSARHTGAGPGARAGDLSPRPFDLRLRLETST